MSTLRRWLAWTERKLARLMISEGLDIGLAEIVQGPLTITYRLRMIQPSRTGLAKLLALGPAIGQELGVNSARITTSARGVLVEIPSPQPRTPSAELLAKASSSLKVAIGLDSFRRPVCLDFETWPHLLILGPTGRGKSQALRSLLFALASQNPPRRAILLILAKKAEDWQAFHPSASCLGLVLQAKEQEQALAWTSKELLKRAERAIKWPHLFLAIDDLANISATASLAGHLGEIASLGRAAGIHLLLSSQTSGRPGGLTQDVEQNLAARLIFGAADAAAGARYAGSGGLQTELVGQTPGDALFVLDGQASRIATGLCLDTSIALLPAGELPRPWSLINRPEQAEQAEQAKAGLYLTPGAGSSQAYGQAEQDRLLQASYSRGARADQAALPGERLQEADDPESLWPL